jgi:hypothetical protein
MAVGIISAACLHSWPCRSCDSCWQSDAVGACVAPRVPGWERSLALGSGTVAPSTNVAGLELLNGLHL